MIGPPAPAAAGAAGVSDPGTRGSWLEPAWLALLASVLVAAFWAFVTVAPNRLAAGQGLRLVQLLHEGGARGWILLPALLWGLAAWAGPREGPSGLRDPLLAVASAAWLAALTWLAGDEALRQAALVGPQAPAQRVALGGAYWGLALLAWLVGMDAIARWRPAGGSRRLAQALWWAPLALLLASARLDELSILKEWANRQDALRAAAGQHLTIVAATLAGALGVGVPSAVFVARRHDRAASRGILALLATVQTIPSVALFGLLIAPLAALGALLPGLGIRGVGFAPALVALVLYALLPIVHAVAAALRGIDAGVIEAALGMGMGRRRLLWQVELPLALPALLAAARVAAVQVVGLAVVAALIGAGGFGALVFQGLASAALDLVLLGVLPVVALAVVLDVGLGILGGAVQRWNRR